MVRWGLFLLMLVVGCDDEAATAPPMDAGRRLADLAPPPPPDAGPDAFQPAWDQGPPPVDAAPLDATPRDARPPSCEEGERRCRVEAGADVFVCEGGAYRVERCPDDRLCREGECLDPLVGCDLGQPACLGIDQPARCLPTADGRGRLEPEGDVCRPDEVCVRGGCVTEACAGAIQTRSYVGCDYWLTDLQSFRYAGLDGDVVRGAPLGLVVMNTDPENDVHVRLLGPDGDVGDLVPIYDVRPPADEPELPDRYEARRLRSQLKRPDGQVTFNGLAQADGAAIPAGGIGTFLIEHTGLPDQTSHVRQEAWRLVTNRPVVAYQFSPLCCNYSFSADASLLLPATALGRRHRVLTAPTTGGEMGGLAIIATAPDTVVTVRPGATRLASDPTGRVVPDAEGVVQVTLQPHEVLTLNGRNGPYPVTERDLSGALVETSEPVAVFASHQCARVPGALGACDHLEEQLFPTDAWGRRFVLTPLATRGRRGVREPTEVNYWRLVADADETVIALSRPYAELAPTGPAYVGSSDCAALLTGPAELTLAAGQWCEIGTLHPFGLEATSPIMVAGLLSGQDSTGWDTPYQSRAGDPSLFLLVPDRQYRADYPFIITDTYARAFVTVVLDPAASLELDGQPVDLAGATPVPGTTRVFAHLILAQGVHRITGNQPFGIIVYAFDDFVSYAFTGGLNLEKE